MLKKWHSIRPTVSKLGVYKLCRTKQIWSKLTFSYENDHLEYSVVIQITVTAWWFLNFLLHKAEYIFYCSTQFLFTFSLSLSWSDKIPRNKIVYGQVCRMNGQTDGRTNNGRQNIWFLIENGQNNITFLVCILSFSLWLQGRSFCFQLLTRPFGDILWN